MMGVAMALENEYQLWEQRLWSHARDDLQYPIQLSAKIVPYRDYQHVGI